MAANITWSTWPSTATSTTASDCYITNKYIKCDWKTFSDYGVMHWIDEDDTKKLRNGKSYDLPDGAKLVIDSQGNYRIDDKAAKVTYKANRIRDFSPHLNASDMVAKFVEYVGTLGVKRAEVMGLPLHLFISWLIIQAAERDGDSLPVDVVPVSADPLLKATLRPKCLLCGRFIKRLHYANRFSFCSPEHAAVHVARLPQPERLLLGQSVSA